MRRPHRVPVAVVVAVVLAPVFVVLRVVDPGRLASLTVEDGPIESLQAALYFGGALAFAVVAVRARRRCPWAGVLALGLFVVAGEEISWGQRIFGISTPESLARDNVQGELNLHNLSEVNGSVRAVGLLVIVVLFFAIPVVWALVPAARRVLDRLRAPRVPWWSVPLAVVALAYMAVPRLLGSGLSFQLDEVGELYLAAAAAAYGWGVLAAELAGATAAVGGAEPAVP